MRSMRIMNSMAFCFGFHFSPRPFLVPLAKGDADRFSEPQGVSLYLPVPLSERDTPPTS